MSLGKVYGMFKDEKFGLEKTLNLFLLKIHKFKKKNPQNTIYKKMAHRRATVKRRNSY